MYVYMYAPLRCSERHRTVACCNSCVLSVSCCGVYSIEIITKIPARVCIYTCAPHSLLQ